MLATRETGAAVPASASAPLGVSFFDGFESSTLGAGWTWVREDASAWSLTERPGFMGIHTQAGTLDDASTANNVLRRAAPGVDYEVSTRVEIALSQEFHEAGLLLYTGDSNFVKISRIYEEDFGGSIFLLRREVGGAGVGAFASPVITETVSEMRLRFVEPQVSGAYRNGLGEWVELGQYTVGPLNTYTYVALTAHHGFPLVKPTSITADFDFLQLVSLLSVRLPIITR